MQKFRGRKLSCLGEGWDFPPQNVLPVGAEVNAVSRVTPVLPSILTIKVYLV